MQDPKSILIRNATLLDPNAGTAVKGDLYIEGGVIVPTPATRHPTPATPHPTPDTRPPPPDRRPDVRVIDAAGLYVAPGLIDVHVHLREPGGEQAETIATGSAAAAHGGFATIVAMPNTRPPIDTSERVAFVLEQGRKAGHAEVLTTACLTRGRAGEEVAPLEELAAAGAVAFTDDGATVQDDDVMRDAMRRAAALGIPVMDHAQDRAMELRGGAMHEGARSRALSIPGIPSEAEIRIVTRDIRLAEETGCALHIQHVSCAASVDLIRDAQARGVRVTGEATPHHLLFCDDDVDPARPDRFKMNPPLRSARDRARIREGVIEGVLSVLATDHAPHSMTEKARGFLKAPFGIVGLETAVGASYTALVRSGRMDRMRWLRAWTTHPARLLKRPAPSLAVGQPAQVVLLDLDTPWTVDAASFRSLGRNTPFDGMELVGRAVDMMNLCPWRT